MIQMTGPNNVLPLSPTYSMFCYGGEHGEYKSNRTSPCLVTQFIKAWASKETKGKKTELCTKTKVK